MPLGTYVQAYEDYQIKNDNKARTIDAIYLRAKPKSGHELMSLETRELITRAQIWEVPITSMVIRAIEELTYNQGIKSLKITGKNKVPLLPANWVAGVDHNEDIENGDDDAYMPTDEKLQDEDKDVDDTENIDQNKIDDLTWQEKQHEDNSNNIERNQDGNNEAEAEEEEEPAEQEEAPAANNVVQPLV